MIRRGAAVGAMIGLLYGAFVLVSAYRAAPGAPGMYEMILQGVLVGALTILAAGAGALIGAAAAFLRRRLQRPG